MFNRITKFIIVLSVTLLLFAFSDCCKANGNLKTFKLNKDRNTIINYDNVEIEVPAGAMEQDLEIGDGDPSLKGIRKPRNFKAVSKPYRFGPHGLKFKKDKPLKLKFKLDPSADEKNPYWIYSVRLYYINRERGILEVVPKQKVNRKTKQLEVEITHFSEYVPGIEPGWDGKGLSPFMDYVTNGEENVNLDPYKLSLNIISNVMNLPGRGINISLNRCYSNAGSGSEYYNPDSDAMEISPGWYWDFLYWDGRKIHVPGGASYEGPNTGDFVYSVITDDDGNEEEIILKNVTYDPREHLIKDSNENWIKYSFGAVYTDIYENDEFRITSITDSIGNKLIFTYKDERDKASEYFMRKPILDKVLQRFADGSTRIILDHTFEFLGGGQYIERFKDVENRVTSYYFENHNLSKIEYFNGAHSEYEYSYYYDDNQDKVFEVRSQKFFEPNVVDPIRVINFSNRLGNFDNYPREKLEVTDNTTRKVYVFQKGYHRQPTSFISSEETYDLSGVLKKRVRYTYYYASDQDHFSRPRTITTEFPNSIGAIVQSKTYYYEYDDWGNPTYIKDPYGNITRMAYANTDSEKNLSKFSTTDNPLGGASYENAKYQLGIYENIGYDKLLTKATFVKDPTPGHNSIQLKQTHYEYDTNGNLKTESEVYNGGYLNTTYTHDQYGNVLSRTDPNGKTLCFEYANTTEQPYKNTYLTRVYKPDNTTIATFDYDFNLGKKTRATDPKGNVYRYEYDALGRLTREWLENNDPNVGVTRQIDYDDLNSIVNLKFGHYISNTNTWLSLQEGEIRYDPLFGKPQLIQRKKQDGSWQKVKEFQYDSNGRAEWESDGMGHKTYYSYDALGRKIQTILPGGATTNFIWDDRTLTTVDANGNKKVQVYDLLDRLAQVREYPDKDDPLKEYVTLYDYDSYDDPQTEKVESHLVKVTNARGAVTDYQFNNLGQLLQVNYPQDGANPMASEKYTYDYVGNLRQKIQGQNSKAIEYDFWAGYRIKSVITQPDGKVVTFGYDKNDNITSITTGAATYSYPEYDARNRARRFRANLDGRTFEFAYDYDAFGRLTGIAYPGRPTPVSYQYDELDRLQQIPGFVNSCSYDLDNKLTGMLYANGVQNTFKYDPVNDRLTDILAGVQGSILNLHCNYDPVGNITQINDDCYGYDGLNRLTWNGNTLAKDPTAKTGSGTVWDYDAAGNMSLKQLYYNGALQSNWTFNNNNANQLASAGPISLSYDELGSVASKRKGADLWNYEYDSEAHLTKVLKNGALIQDNYYDANGMRIKKVTGGKATYYLYNGANPMLEYSDEKGYTYFIYAGKKSIAEEENGQVKFVHKDHLGSTRAKTDAGGRLITRQEHEPYGAPKGSEIIKTDLSSFEAMLSGRLSGDPLNSNFEKIFDEGKRWKVGMHNSPAEEYCEVAETSTAAGGKKVARIYDNGSGTWKAFIFHKKIALAPGKWYRISVKARIVSGQGTKYAQAYLSYNANDNATNKYVTKTKTWTASELSSGNWVTKYVIFQVPAGYADNQISPYLYGHHGGAGIVEYDDYRIEEFDTEPNGPPYNALVYPENGSFESSLPDLLSGNPSQSSNENILFLGSRWRARMHYCPADEYCEIAQSSTAAGGRKVARIYDNGSGTWKAFSFNQAVALVPGKWYRISLKARITTGKGTKYARAYLSLNDADNAANRYVTKQATWTASELASGNWVTKYEIFQVPLGYTYNQISPYLYGNYGGAGIVEYDDYRIEEFDSAPSGPPVDEIDPGISKEKYKFTGKDLDEETGLMYFGARFYDAEVGRFITRDTFTYMPNDERILMDWVEPNEERKILRIGLKMPEVQNVYVYCLNNPLRFIDLDGNEAEDTNDDNSTEITTKTEESNDEEGNRTVTTTLSKNGEVVGVRQDYYDKDGSYKGYSFTRSDGKNPDGTERLITTFFDKHGNRNESRTWTGVLGKAVGKIGTFSVRYGVVHYSGLKNTILGKIPGVKTLVSTTLPGPFSVIFNVLIMNSECVDY